MLSQCFPGPAHKPGRGRASEAGSLPRAGVFQPGLLRATIRARPAGSRGTLGAAIGGRCPASDCASSAHPVSSGPVDVPRPRPSSPCWLFEPLLSVRARGRPPWRSVRPVHRGQETRGWPRGAPCRPRPAPVTLLFKACACGVAGLLAVVCGVGFSFAPSLKSFHFSRCLLPPGSASAARAAGIPGARGGLSRGAGQTRRGQRGL